MQTANISPNSFVEAFMITTQRRDGPSNEWATWRSATLIIMHIDPATELKGHFCYCLANW